MKMTFTSTLIASAVALATLTGAAQAKGRLVVYCSATNEMCEAETKAFGEKYDVKTSFIRNGSGSTLAKVDAEKKNPQADVWYGGTLDPQSQAGDLPVCSENTKLTDSSLALWFFNSLQIMHLLPVPWEDSSGRPTPAIPTFVRMAPPSGSMLTGCIYKDSKNIFVWIKSSAKKN